MSVILNFSDLGCLNESAAGSMGAGMASFVRAGFPAARGFVVTPLVFSDFMKKDEVRAALDLFGSGAEDPEDSWRTVRSLFARSRLNWSHELEILTAFRELDSTVSVCITSRYGADSHPVYAGTGQDLLEAIKHCWQKWLRTSMDRLRDQDLPAVVVKEVLDSEVSVELRKKGNAIRARAVFGLPEGLSDPAISSDTFEFTPDGKLDRMEMRPQGFQYIMKDHGPSRVSVSRDFREEEKVTGEMLAGLEGVIDFMRGHASAAACVACFVSSRPVICSATLMSEPAVAAELPSREHSMTLMEPVAAKPDAVPQAPAVATMLFLQVENLADITAAGETYLDGIVLSGGQTTAASIAEMAAEAKRKLRASSMIVELNDAQPQTLQWLAESLGAIREGGLQPGILIPGIRSSDELSKVLRDIGSTVGDDTPQPSIWVRVMYPSNLFFMDSLAGVSDVRAIDLDSLGRLMLGGEGPGNWLNHSAQAVERALEEPLTNKTGPLAIMADDLVSTPGLLEFLVRRGADIICVRPSEVHTLKHIIASLERRMLLEQGRS